MTFGRLADTYHCKVSNQMVSAGRHGLRTEFAASQGLDTRNMGFLQSLPGPRKGSGGQSGTDR